MYNNTTVFLIRHGKIDNPNNIVYGSNIEMHLTDEGRIQFKHFAIRIRESGEIPSKIISSPLERAVDSARILAKEWDIAEIEKEPDLKDCFIPAVAGKKLGFLDELYKKGTDEYSEEFVKLGNESREDIGDRMLRVFNKAILENSTTALVSHGDPIFFLMYKLENPNSQIPTMSLSKRMSEYLEKGHAWKLVIDGGGKILSKERISPEWSES